jgi:integrase
MRGRVTKSKLQELQRQSHTSGKAVLLYDEAIKGFGARVAPSQTITFFFEYRLGGRKGKTRRQSLGRMGDLTPEQARRKAEALRGQTLQGVDVAEERKRERAELTSLTFAEAAERYLSSQGRNNVSWAETRRLIHHDAIPAFGNRRLNTISRGEIATLIDRIAARAPVTARALFAAIRPMFQWALERELIETTPCEGLRPPAPPRARDRVLSLNELRALWLSAEQLGYPFGPLWQMLILTGQRLNEVAGARWEEINLDDALWSIPGRLMGEDGSRIRGTKNTAAHWVDLSPQALRVLDDCPRQSGPYVFSVTGRTPVSGFSKVKARLDSLMSQHLRHQPDAWRNHDIRRSVATHMAEELGIDEGVIERILNHKPHGIKAVYQRQQYRERRREALLEWGALVAELVADEAGE